MLTIRTAGVEDYLDPQSGQAWVQAIIIGGHGVGKTPFAAQWPKPVFAMCEHGAMSLTRTKTSYADINTDRDMDAFVEEIRRDCVIKDLSKRKYLTVVVDTIDSYQKRLMQQRVREASVERFTGWDNWDWLDARLVKALTALAQMPINVVVNVHYKESIVGEGEDKSVLRELRLKGDQKNSIFQEYDLIGFMENYYTTEAGERQRSQRIRWKPVPGYEMVRDRSFTLPEFTEVRFDPSDFQTIFDCIVGGVDELEESHVVAEVEVQGQPGAEGLPAPDEGAGPVANPSLPPAAKTAAAKPPTINELMERVGNDPEKAKQMLEWEQAREGGTAVRSSFVAKLQKVIDEAQEQGPEESATDVPQDGVEPAQDGPSEDEAAEVLAAAGVASEVVSTEPAPGGTAEAPMVMDEQVVNNLDGPKFAALNHVHSPEGRCLKNTFIEKGEDGVKHCPLVAQSAEADTPIEAPADVPVVDEPTSDPAVTKTEQGLVDNATGEIRDSPDPAAQEAPEPGQNICGSQPVSLVGKFEPKQGCGKAITTENKAALSVVKHRTLLCKDCMARLSA